MKIFVVTRLGTINSDPVWWDHQLSLFEAVTLPSMEKAINDNEIYWMLFINRATAPIEAVRRLRLRIESSCIRKNIHIVYENSYMVVGEGFNYVNEYFKVFVPTIVESGEYYLTHCIDGDDAIRYDFYDEVKVFVNKILKEKGIHKFVFTFQTSFFYYLRQSNYIKKKHYFGSYNGLIYDNDQTFHWSHQIRFLGYDKSYFSKNGYAVYAIDTDKPMGIYNCHNSNTYKQGIEWKRPNLYISNEPVSDISVLKDYGIYSDSINLFLKRFPKSLKFEIRQLRGLPFKRTFGSFQQTLIRYYDLLKKSLDYNDVAKEDIRKNIVELQKKGKTFFYAIMTFYELDYEPNSSFLQIEDGIKYLKKLNNENYFFSISYKGDICFCFNSTLKGVENDSSKTDVILQGFLGNSKEGKMINVIYAKSIRENNVSLSSIEYDGLEFSMNLDGLNIVVFDPNKKTICDIVNVNIFNNYELRR